MTSRRARGHVFARASACTFRRRKTSQHVARVTALVGESDGSTPRIAASRFTHRDLEEAAQRDAVIIPRPEPRDTRRHAHAEHSAAEDARRPHLEEDRGEQQRRLHALPRHHEDREEEDPEKRGSVGPPQAQLEPLLDVVVHPLTGAQHVDRHRGDHDGRGRSQDGFPQGMVRRLLEEDPRAHAQDDRGDDRPADCADELHLPGLVQLRARDRHDEEGLDPSRAVTVNAWTTSSRMAPAPGVRKLPGKHGRTITRASHGAGRVLGAFVRYIDAGRRAS